MIWNILFPKQVVVPLPQRLTTDTMYPFIGKAIDEQCDALCSTIYFDFSPLQFVEPSGIVVLSNLIEYFKKLGVKVWFKGHGNGSEALKFLDDSDFFKRYLGKSVSSGSRVRQSTIPLHLVEAKKTSEFLGFRLMPWIATEVGLSEKSLASVMASLEEIFHNISDHSGVNLGCAFAQHYPNRGTIQVAISDFGLGIPAVVATKVPNLTDQAAIAKACEEGFTTQTNVRNRGAGLPNLMRYVTQRNHGTVLIASAKGAISAVKSETGTKLRPRSCDGFYPGTLVRVILSTTTLEKVVGDTEFQPFIWT